MEKEEEGGRQIERRYEAVEIPHYPRHMEERRWITSLYKIIVCEEGCLGNVHRMFTIHFMMNYDLKNQQNICLFSPSAPGLIFSRFFENLTIALKKYFSSSDFGSPRPY